MQIQDIVKKYVNDEKLFNQIQRQVSLKNIALDDIAQIQFKIYIDEDDEDGEINGFELYKYFLQIKIVAQHLLNLFKNKEYFSSLSKNMIFNQFDCVDRSYIAAIRSGNPTIDIVTKVILDYVILLRILSIMKESTIIDANHSENDDQIPLNVETNSTRNEVSKTQITSMSSKKLSESETNSEPACMYCDTKFSPNDEKCAVCEAVVPINVARTSLISHKVDHEDLSGYRKTILNSFPLTASHPSQSRYPKSISVNYPTVSPKDSTKAANVDSSKLPLNGRHEVECTYCNSPNDYNAERCKTCLGEFDYKVIKSSPRLKCLSKEDRPKDKNKNQKEMNKENDLVENFSDEAYSIKVRDCKPIKAGPVGEEGGHSVVLRNSGNDRRSSGSNKSLNLKVKEKNVDNAEFIKMKSQTIGTKSGWTCSLCSYLNMDIKLTNCQVCMKGLRPEEDKGISYVHNEARRKSPKSPKKTTEGQHQSYTMYNNEIYGKYPIELKEFDKRYTFNEAASTARNDELQNTNKNESLTSSPYFPRNGDPQTVTKLEYKQKKENIAICGIKEAGGLQSTFTAPKKDMSINAESKRPQYEESPQLKGSTRGIGLPNVHMSLEVRANNVAKEDDRRISPRLVQPVINTPNVSNSFQKTKTANPASINILPTKTRRSQPTCSDETSPLGHTPPSTYRKRSFLSCFSRNIDRRPICSPKQCIKCEHREGKEKYANLCKKCHKKSCDKCQKGVAKTEFNQLCKKCFNKSSRECRK